MTLRTFIAREVVVDAHQVFEGGGVAVDREGRVAALLESGEMGPELESFVAKTVRFCAARREAAGV